jgi:hypothetical protein
VEHVYGVPVPEGLHEAIEAERGNLCKAESLLGCLAISMEYEGDDTVNRPYYPDVAELARELVRKSINGLDSLVLQQHLLRNKVKERPDPSLAEGGYAVLDRNECMSLVAQQEQAITIVGFNPSAHH